MSELVDATDRVDAARNGPVVLYFVTEDWYFCSHRLPLAVAAREAGYTVYVVTRAVAHRRAIEAAGLNLIPLDMRRRSKNPVAEALVLKRLIGIYRRVKPSIVHHVALKPVLYGSIAARFARVPARVNAMAGLGYLFASQSRKARLLRLPVRLLFRLLLNNDRSVLLLQNSDDVETVCGSGTVSVERTRLVLGSGVDMEQYLPGPEAEGVPIVLLASRMLWNKGVGEFVEAARRLRQRGVRARFVLAGESDDQNPESIDAAQLAKWDAEGDAEWWGRRDDMPEVLARVHVVCLPTTYGEGVPKILIEAASCGRPIVTTDAPGCREIVSDGSNGILVPPRDVPAIVRALETLLSSPETRRRMGRAGREVVRRKFALTSVVKQTLTIYERMLE